MKHLSWLTGAKIIAWLLLAVFLLVGGCSLIAVGILASANAYSDQGHMLRYTILMRYAYNMADYAIWSYDGNSDYYRELLSSPERCNFGYIITDSAGEILAQNFPVETPQYTITQEYDRRPTGEPYQTSRSFTSYEDMWTYLARLREEVYIVSEESIPTLSYQLAIHWDDEESGGEAGKPVEVMTFDSAEAREEWLSRQEGFYDVYNYESLLSVELRTTCLSLEAIKLTGYVPQNLTASDELSFTLRLADTLIAQRNLLIVTACAGLALSLLLIVFLFCGAGHRPAQEEIRLTWFDRIPLELLIALAVLFVCAPVALGFANFKPNPALLVFFLLLALFSGLFCIGVLLSLAVRIKHGSWWKNTICGWLALAAVRFFSFARQRIGYLARGIPMIWRIVVAWALLSLLELLFAVNNDLEFFWIVEKVLLTPLILIVGIHMVRLRQAAQNIAAGDLDTQVDLRYMLGDLRRHGEDLNHITVGLQGAVDRQLRSERLKTELITNVSHDIKTPLTSIVNYVDLLSQEEMPSSTAKEYLEVLRRQSARLRKLTEDLVEASKAATGNVDVRAEPLDVNVLLSQTAGEYEEKLRSLELEPILSLGSDSAMICADGRLLWRVFDNLMNNICKYAMPGTRVYLSAQPVGQSVEITFRNISRYQLNISSEELLERFVRGDSSRSTEGSGLGLSIARSLTELQGGSFDLMVDGDLFKAVVSFQRLADSAENS